MSKSEEISKLFALKQEGILTEEEFNREKALLLSGDHTNTGQRTSSSITTKTISPGHIDPASNFASCSMIQMSCSKCKGEVQFLPGAEVLRCSFCGNEVSAENNKSKALQIPDLLIPFSFGQKDAASKFYDHLANDDLVPDDIFKNKQAISVFGVFQPSYLFNGKYEGNWTALTIRKYDVTNSSNEKIGETEKTAPISGQVRGPINFALVASQKTSGKSVDAHNLKAKLKNYDSAFVQGFLIESLTSSKSQEQCEPSLREEAIKLATEEAKKMIPTKDYEKFSVNVDVTAQATAFLQPFWVCEINYEDSIYSLWLSGTNMTGEILGKLPVDATRESLLKSLKDAGMDLFAAATCVCGFGGLIFAWAANAMDETSPMPGAIFLLTLVTSIYFLVKGFQKRKEQSLKVKETIQLSKDYRENSKPNV